MKVSYLNATVTDALCSSNHIIEIWFMKLKNQDGGVVKREDFPAKIILVVKQVF